MVADISYILGFLVVQLLLAVLFGYLLSRMAPKVNHAIICVIVTVGLALIGGIDMTDVIVSLPIFLVIYKKWIWIKPKKSKTQQG